MAAKKKQKRAPKLSLLDIQPDTGSWRLTVALIAVAWLAGVAIRMIWPIMMADQESFKVDGHFMLTTHDAYAFASGAQRLLDDLHAHNPRVPSAFAPQGAIVALAAFLDWLLPWNMETVAFWIPVAFAGAIAAPIVLIGRTLGSTTLGFVAAVISVIAWSFYNRTMAGYFDTDVFSLLLPLLVLCTLGSCIVHKRLAVALGASLLIPAYSYFYSAGTGLGTGLVLLATGWLAVFQRRDPATWRIVLVLAPAILDIHWAGKGVLSLAAYATARWAPLATQHFRLGALGATAAVVVQSGIWRNAVLPLQQFLARGVSTEAGGWHYLAVTGTISEALGIPFATFAERVSGAPSAVIIACIGLVALTIRRPWLLISIPLAIIGFSSFRAGLRFTIYLVPLAALGTANILLLVKKMIPHRPLSWASVAAGLALSCYPHIRHAYDYHVPTVLSPNEVQALRQLGQRGDSHDYVVAWWDYGYPIWFYSGMSTLLDGGKHDNDNFIASRVLSTGSQREAAQLARVAIETYAAGPPERLVVDSLFGTPASGKNPNAVLREIAEPHYQLPQKSREIYLYLPFRMLEIISPVWSFASVDLVTGKETPHTLYVTQRYRSTGSQLQLGNGVVADVAKGVLTMGGGHQPLHSFVDVSLNRDGIPQTQVQAFDENADLSVVFLRSYNRMMVVDRATLDSVYFQLFFFGNVDTSLFEPVVNTPLVRIYRVKV